MISNITQVNTAVGEFALVPFVRAADSDACSTHNGEQMGQRIEVIGRGSGQGQLPAMCPGKRIQSKLMETRVPVYKILERLIKNLIAV